MEKILPDQKIKMFLVRNKGKRKVTVHKEREWNREIKFNPVLVYTSYEVGNNKIRFCRELNKDELTIKRNGQKRKFQKNFIGQKTKGKSPTVNIPRKVVTKHPVSMNDQIRETGDKNSNQAESVGSSFSDQLSKNDLLKEESGLRFPTSSDYTKQNKKEYSQSQFVKELETFIGFSDEPVKAHSDNESNFSNEDTSDNERKNEVFKVHSSYNSANRNKEYYVDNQFLKESDTLKYFPEEIIKSDLNNTSNSKSISPKVEIEYTISNEEEKKVVTTHSPDYTNQNNKYDSNQLLRDSEASKHIPDLNVKPNSSSIFPDAVIEFPSDDVIIYPNTSQYSCPHPMILTSLENIASDSDDLYQNIRSKTWSLDSSKVLMTPSKRSIHEDHSLISIGCDLMKEEEELNATEYTNIELIQLKDSLNTNLINDDQLLEQAMVKQEDSVDNKLNDLIKNKQLTEIIIVKQQDNINNKLNDYQQTEQTILKLEDRIDNKLNHLINNQLVEQTLVKLEDDTDNKLNDHQLLGKNVVEKGVIESNLNDNQFQKQRMMRLQDRDVNDQIPNRTIAKFIVYKKSQENQDNIIIDSSEASEQNIFSRNKILSGLPKKIINYAEQKSSNRGAELFAEETESDNSASPEQYSLVETLHDELSEKFGLINFEKIVQFPKILQDPSSLISQNQSFSQTSNMSEDHKVTDLFTNLMKHIQTSENSSQEARTNESNSETKEPKCFNETPLQNSEDKNIISSLVPLRTGPDYFSALLECRSALTKTMNNTETLYFKEMMKHGLGLALGETSGNTTDNVIEKNMARNENLHNREHEKTSYPTSSSDSKNDSLIKSEESQFENNKFLYHLASKSKHSIENNDRKLDEIEKRTDEIINKIIKARTQEELLQLMTPKQKYSETESTETNDKKEALITKNPESYAFIMEEETENTNYDLPIHIVPESNHNNQGMNNSIQSNHSKKLEHNESDDVSLKQKITHNSRSLNDSSNNIKSKVKMEHGNEQSEKFMSISEEKESSNLILNVERKQPERNNSLEESIVRSNLSDEKSTPSREENDENAYLYFANQIVKSPYDIHHSNQNVAVNLDNDQKETLQERIYRCFKKINFWSKIKP